jgi:predicted RNase H-like nuclease
MLGIGRVVAGVDGCKKGWVVVLVELNGEGGVGSEECRVVSTFREVLDLSENPRYVGIDIPIGLPVNAVPGGRSCDREARRMLGRKRGSSVFAPPVRAVLSADSYEKASALNRSSSKHAIGLSKQVYGLVAKLREVHDAMSPDLQMRVREVHPEVSFTAMNDSRPLETSKRSAEGQEERVSLLEQHFPKVRETLDSMKRGVLLDAIDAYAAAWSAWRMARGKASYIPQEPELDSRGLRMGIWF